MTRTKVKKRFDCIEYKDRVQGEVYAEIRELTLQQQIEYFNQRAEDGKLAQWWKKIRRP